MFAVMKINVSYIKFTEIKLNDKRFFFYLLQHKEFLENVLDLKVGGFNFLVTQIVITNSVEKKVFFITNMIMPYLELKVSTSLSIHNSAIFSHNSELSENQVFLLIRCYYLVENRKQISNSDPSILLLDILYFNEKDNQIFKKKVSQEGTP